MNTVLVFDLDDTLYDERTYVESGFRAVAAFGAARFGWNPEESFRHMVASLDRDGRGAVFDRWLAEFGRSTKGLVQQCVREYRNHTPHLRLLSSAQALLPMLGGYPKYIVTDGHKLVQQRKVDALGVEHFFDRVFITHRFGIRNAKPSTYCFDLIRRRENCAWADVMYVGDNPAKDFVGLNRLGARTVRVLTGVHRCATAAAGYDAQHTILNLDHFVELLERLDHAR